MDTKNLKPRTEAIKAGDLMYLGSRPCCNGHAPVRYTISGSCRECQRQHRVAFRAAIMAARELAAEHGR